VFEESLVWSKILEPILHRKPVRGDLLLCKDGKLQLKRASAAKKKSDMNKNKKRNKM